MADALQVARDAMLSSSAVTALVGTRVSPVYRDQNTAVPAATLSNVGKTPINGINGHAGLDANRIQVDCWAESYTVARQLAEAVRTAMQTAGHILEFETDDRDDPSGQFRVIQDFYVWT